ncbi:hypothetical protein P692DRAFT_20817621 [Suillus brevipes Sb2]|nr:hypothetical protein P692DRAFT_20817621 [Suillus brevipes Sb2]
MCGRHSQSGSSVPSTPTTWVTPRTQHRHSTCHAQEIASPSHRRVPDNLTRSTFEASPSSFSDISDENSPVIPPFEFSLMRLKQGSGGPLAPLSNCALRDNSPRSPCLTPTPAISEMLLGEISAPPPRLLEKYSNVDSSVISPSPALTNRQLGQRRRCQWEQLERAKSGQDVHVLDSATTSALFTQAVNPQPVSLSSNVTPDEQQRAGHLDFHQLEASNPAQSDDGKFDSIIASSDVLSQYYQEPTANAENSMEMGSSSSSVTLSRRQLGQCRRRE